MKYLRDLTLAVFGIVLAAVVMAYAGIPSRVTVLESQFAGIDKKLDQLLARRR